MQARAWNDGGSTYGISVGPKNRDEFFDKSWTEIEVEIDDEVHLLPLSKGFWKDCPEFRSPIIREWLRRHGLTEWPNGHPPRFELIPLNANRFRLVR